MRLKRKGGLKLVCPKHGPAAVVIRGCGPSAKYPFEVRCKGKTPAGRTTCQHHEYASDNQVAGILRAHPECDAKDYDSSWDEMFELKT